MKVTSGSAMSYPNLFDVQQQTGKPSLQTGVQLPRPDVHQDLLEISDQARQIAEIVNHEAVKVSIPDRPQGAPDDYVKASDIMKRFEPQTYEKMNGYFEQNDMESGLSLLLSFAKKLPQHPDWLKQYREEMR